MKVGITISHSQNDWIWSNGIKLNALMLAKLLNFSEKIDNVYLINYNGHLSKDGFTSWDLDKYPTISEEEALEVVDLIIILGCQLDDEYLKRFKQNKNKKVILYICGNHYVMEAENVMFKERVRTIHWSKIIDETWIIPQMEYHNLYYIHTFNKVPVRVVPFVWDPEFIQKRELELGLNAKYTESDIKKISVFEPNINIYKYSMMPIHIVEWSSWKKEINDKIDNLYLTNSKHLIKNHEFNQLVKHLDIFKIGKISCEDRFDLPFFLSKYTDIVISHQWGNPLNYLYFDVLFYNYPLIHNAHMIKDMGYYYEDCNIEMGSKQLDFVIKHHDQNQEEYIEKNKKALLRYTSSNKELIRQYESLIFNLFQYENKNRVTSGYNPNTNLLQYL